MRSFTLRAGLVLLAALASREAEAAPPARREASTGAAARASRVVIVGAEADDALIRETATRLRAELGAAGFEVVRIPGPVEGDPRAWMERAAQEAGAFAAATIVRSQAGATADLWIVDRVTRKTVVRTVEVGGAAAPSVLAVRTVELLRASLLEASAPPGRERAGEAGDPRAGGLDVPDDVKWWMTPARRPAGLLAGVSLEAGAVVLLSADGIGPSVGPALRLSLGAAGSAAEAGSGMPAGLAARLTFAGPALGPALQGERGTVSVRQEMAFLEAVWAVETGTAVVPVVSAGAGGYHLFASGAPEAPLVGATGEVWSIAALLGGGAGVRVTERAALLLDVHALFAEPRAVVALGGERVGSAGRPSFAGFLGLLVRL